MNQHCKSLTSAAKKCMRHALKKTCLAAAGIILLSGLTQAQDRERLMPKQIQEEEKKTESVPLTPTPQVSKDKGETVLTPSLSGLVFVSSADKITPKGLAQRGIVVDGYQEPEFFQQMNSYIGKPLTLNGLSEILKKVVLHFRETDRPVVDVYTPEQDISSGTIQVVVIIGKLGAVKTEGNRWFKDSALTRSIRARRGEVIHSRQLLEDLNWMNQNPFRQTDIIFSRGTNPGETDIKLKTQDRFPLRVFTGYEDSGTELTGKGRMLAGFNWGNVFGTDHQLSYQYTTDKDFDKYRGHSVSYLAPLPWRHTLLIGGSYAKSEPDLDIFNMKGKSWEVFGRYTIPLRNTGKYSHYFQSGFDYKYSDNNLEFSNIPIFNKKINVAQGMIGYKGMLPDKYGETAFMGSLFLSPGGMGKYNDDKYFSAMHSGARARYSYAQISGDRMTRLPAQFGWKLRLNAQFASDSLVDSERMGLGGYDTVRGYEERTSSSDGGILLVNEVLTRSFNVGEKTRLKRNLGEMQFLAFLDYGHSKNHGSESSTSLASTGIGLRYSFGNYASLRLDYGWQLKDLKISGTDRSSAHIGVVIGF